MDILEVKRNLNKTVYWADNFNIPEPMPFTLTACIARKSADGFLRYQAELTDKTGRAVMIVELDEVKLTREG